MKKLLSIEMTAERLNIKPRSIYNGVAPNSKRPFPIRPIRIGRLVRFDEGDIELFIENQKKQVRIL